MCSFKSARDAVASSQAAATAPPTAPASRPADFEPSEEDVKLVMEAAGCNRDAARRALRETGGDLAEAIVKLQG